ncbi:type II secretion system F family protein [Paenibacillus solisilvae]|uniref:Type II secretion system F family protein n=1 Tax=Paenibacillus solisilvae TaxID=2486751 RepID=A0ABW0VUT8_9BACL
MNKRQRSWLDWLGWPDSKNEPGVRSGSSLPVYTEYRLTEKQFVLASAAGGMIAFTAAFLFYHSILVSLIFSAGGILAPRQHRDSLLLRRRERLKIQFKEALYSLTSSLAAGRSVENAFIASLEDLRLLYPDPQTEVIMEFEIIRSRMAYGEPLEQALDDFGRRAQIDDITQFVDVFMICKRSGGDLVEVIRRTSQTIGEKLEIQQEIAVMVAQKRYESRIMMAVPFVFLAFLSMTAPDYMAPLYKGAGYVLLTVSLLLLAVCCWFMIRVMSIRL